ncbi:MAG: phosphoglycerate dehydrogenase [Planctomycetota bacterium]|jgi:D-3-phosphoglycerate dehydrogenase|nr:phosphoglycerate dehydrogenase [Planctomycetota bacterium]
MTKILITPRSLKTPDHPALAPLREAGYEIVIPAPGVTPDPETLKKVLPGCAGWLAGVEKITADVIQAASGLRVISRNGTGVDNVDLEAAAKRGVEVARTPGANARGVAELAIGLILSIARNIPKTDASIASGGWERKQGIELENRTLGVVGCGQIGKLVVRLGKALGMRAIGYDLYPDKAFEAEGFSYVEPDGIAKQADVVSLHIPGGDKPFVDAAFLEQAKPGVIVVNTSRAAAVDDNAMLAALDSGKAFGYGVDVFDPEPPGKTALTTHPKAVCTSHVGGFTAESVLRAARQAAENIVLALSRV